MANGRSNMPKTPECGFTDPTSGAVQPLPDQVEWYGGKMNHPGPCKIWCDDVIVLPFTVDCSLTFPDGKFTYDKASCVGKKRLTMCVQLEGGNFTALQVLVVVVVDGAVRNVVSMPVVSMPTVPVLVV
ncbi:unnamed protein product [Phytophthora lilii]|uniref:Unnamed protein product n=1 Tax=Phytophthora lilii TaxID=2077276 RepID=A0A9W6XQM1_9STRA|nr:unnamed protein product [Phytophthora lilii]